MNGPSRGGSLLWLGVKRKQGCGRAVEEMFNFVRTLAVAYTGCDHISGENKVGSYNKFFDRAVLIQQPVVARR